MTATALRDGRVWWGDSEHLLAGIFDLLAGANWQRGGGKGTRPKPIRRPTDKAQETRYVGKAISLDEARKRSKRAKAS